MRTLTATEALRERLAAAMEADPAVFLLGEDIGRYGGAFGVTRGLLDRFGPERVRNTPISEATVVGAAIGAAIEGLRPVVEIMFMDFILLALDQLINQAAKMRDIFGMNCPLVLRTPAGGGRGYGATHSQCLERHLFGAPGWKIAAPATPADASALLATALASDEPVLFVEHKMLYPLRGELPDGLPAPLPFGKARVARPGEDITLVAWSYMSTVAGKAADLLAEQGIEAEVIDLRTPAPLDIETICESVARTSRLLIVEEGARTGGLGAEIGCQVFERAYDLLDGPIRRVTAPDRALPATRALEDRFLPNPARVAAEAHALVNAT